MPNEENNGYLQIRATTARGALPVENAQVYISETDRDGQNTGVIASGRTDRSGLTEKFSLPAPPRENSESPGIPNPYTKYNVEIYADGYYPIENFDVPVFPGILSVQPAELIPVRGGGAQ